MNNVLIIGCGDIGARMAVLWQRRKVLVAALARSAESAGRLRQLGIAPVAGDLDRAGSLRGLSYGDAIVYYLAPPPGDTEGDPRMATFIQAMGAARPKKVIYVSTSGVYGDRGGAWVSEEEEPTPDTCRARRRLAAENALRAWGQKAELPVIILRVGGIYGPGRLPIERLRRGLPVLREQECGYSNRIHADDLAEILLAAAERGQADRVYNVADDAPGTMTQYFFAVADRLGLPRPPTLTMAEARERLSPAMLSYLTESRRLDNRCLHKELGVTLRYPSLEEGLAALEVERELTER